MRRARVTANRYALPLAMVGLLFVASVRCVRADSAILGPALSSVASRIVAFENKDGKSNFRLIDLPILEGMKLNLDRRGDAKATDFGLLNSPIFSLVGYSSRCEPGSATQTSRFSWSLLKLPFIELMNLDRKVGPGAAPEYQSTTQTKFRLLDLPLIGPLLEIGKDSKGVSARTGLLFGL
ncbi:MAG: hypothetical protein HY270_21920 [Deltaproteobacteria bacterium]|nr:hypothetical protein [Deltaproteobacteria bacterium]